MTESEFAAMAADRGHGGLRPVEFAPGRRPDLHPHDWSTLLLLTSGSLTLAFVDGQIELEPGDWCEVGAGEMHSERAGTNGAAAVLATRPPG